MDSGNLGKESLHVRKVSKVSPKEQSTVTKATDDLKTTHENKPGVMAQKTSNAAGNGWPGSITQQNTALPIEGFHVTVPQTWLYGQATLQQTGQSISAELEVAMLCMQKRLDQVRDFAVYRSGHTCLVVFFLLATHYCVLVFGLL